MSEDLTTDLAYFLDQIIQGSGAGDVWTANGLGVLPTWQPGGGGGGATTLDGLTDVVITSPAQGAALVFDSGSGNWIDGTPSATTLDGLTDVVITAPADTEVLTYDSGSGNWINAPAGGGVTLPITGAANDVVLENADPAPLISLTAAGELLLTPHVYIGDGGDPFAEDGRIRGDNSFAIYARDSGDTGDLLVVEVDNDDLVFGGATVTSLNFFSGSSSVIINGTNGAVDISGALGAAVGSIRVDVSATPFASISVTDAGAATNTLYLEGPADGNALFPTVGTPDLGTSGAPWKDGYFSGDVEMAAGTAAATPAQTNVTGSRALNTTYTAGARSIMVMATFRCAVTLAGGNAYVQAKSDGSTPPTTIASGLLGIQAGLPGEDNSFQLSFVVAAGQNYRIDSSATNGSVTLGAWFEGAF